MLSVLSIESFHKARHGQPLFPFKSQRGFECIYNESDRKGTLASAEKRRDRSPSLIRSFLPSVNAGERSKCPYRPAGDDKPVVIYSLATVDFNCVDQARPRLRPSHPLQRFHSFIFDKSNCPTESRASSRPAGLGTRRHSNNLLDASVVQSTQTVRIVRPLVFVVSSSSCSFAETTDDGRVGNCRTSDGALPTSISDLVDKSRR
jgi:hypothetical protein